MCENLAESHNSYLKWLHEFKLIPDDELLKYYSSVGPSESDSFLKQFHYICENLLLCYRMTKKFDEALDTLRTAHSFIAEFDLDTVELEWLVTNWCKIKRDLWKVKRLCTRRQLLLTTWT